MNVVSEAALPRPLVVDVDGTLVRSDLLHEAALQFVAARPIQSWQLLRWAMQGKAKLKDRLAASVDASAESVPLRAETLALIREAQANEQPVYLASASHRRWVEPIAKRVGGLSGVFATDEHTNLAGRAKAAALIEAFGARGFDYAGDARVDFPVWEAARQCYLVSHSRGLEAATRARFPDALTIARPRPSLHAHARALRGYQWAKNILVFLPLVAGHGFLQLGTLLAATTAFFAFCLAASSAYIINDLLDLPSDRDHPQKRFRPFAAGDVPVVHGIVMSALLMAGAILLALTLPSRFFGILASYVVLTLAYSFVLKRRVLVDVIVLGGLYTIRVLGGVTATDQRQSQWLLMFSLFLFLSLAVVKRCSELVDKLNAGGRALIGRGYRSQDLAVLLPLGAAAGYGAVLVFTLYLSSPEVVTLYTHPGRLWLICPLLLYWISRVLIVANRGEMHHDPLIYALTDRVSWLTGLCAALVILASI